MDDWFPLEHKQRILQLEPLTNDTCICGHQGFKHASTGSRCCFVEGCDCYKFRRFEVKQVQQEFDKAMVYFHEQESYDDRVKWVFKNIKFFRNIPNDELYFYWWKYILKYDPFEAFMDKDILNTIKHYGNPSTIERSARKAREDCKKKLHDTPEGCQYCHFDPNLIEAKIEKEFGIFSYYSENKS